MNIRAWGEVAGVIGIFVLLTVVIAVAISQFAATWRAKAVLAREEEYRKLAERAVSSQESIERQLADMQERLRSVEKVLKEVE
ncbi:hypothetical protein SAMN05421504_104811 [Amycolatopsis xylanica]|uniref:Uncharacterized protein n=1 Tax=Amycolatopsis xylanica TaxID=589385 RepID=A0A1H3HT97_9PSEU|nr:hypothetical protein [Amycolatopsis xylanica]SDY18662.1 hypothetical protein SAMN05421504_104811 [Amycolatopsis xylanica]